MGKNVRQLGSGGDFPHRGPRGDVPEKELRPGVSRWAERSGPSEILPPPCRAESESGGLWDPSVGGCPCPGAHMEDSGVLAPLCDFLKERQMATPQGARGAGLGQSYGTGGVLPLGCSCSPEGVLVPPFTVTFL